VLATPKHIVVIHRARHGVDSVEGTVLPAPNGHRDEVWRWGHGACLWRLDRASWETSAVMEIIPAMVPALG